MLNPWIMLLVGLVLGWTLTWLLQRRLDDSLTEKVTQLQRELSECNMRLGELGAAPAVQAGVAASIPAMETAELQELAQTKQFAPAPQAEYVAPLVTEAEPMDNAQNEPEPIPADVVEEALGLEEPAPEETVVVESAAAVAEAEVAEMETRMGAAETALAEVDDLTIIRGIGPKFAETLQAAGITTYAVLATLTPERLQEIVQPAAWQKVEFEDWIAQAKELAG